MLAPQDVISGGNSPTIVNVHAAWIRMGTTARPVSCNAIEQVIPRTAAIATSAALPVAPVAMTYATVATYGAYFFGNNRCKLTRKKISSAAPVTNATPKTKSLLSVVGPTRRPWSCQGSPQMSCGATTFPTQPLWQLFRWLSTGVGRTVKTWLVCHRQPTGGVVPRAWDGRR